jgi:hypothetical protein
MSKDDQDVGVTIAKRALKVRKAAGYDEIATDAVAKAMAVICVQQGMTLREALEALREHWDDALADHQGQDDD